jgi:hypothetical protein
LSRPRFLPFLERLEARHCPSLSVANNVNLSKLLDNQSDETIAINPNNPQQIFAAATSWHGGDDGASYGPTLSGLFYAYSSDGGTTWTSGTMAYGADGTSPGYGLPAAGHSPHAAFDKYGNLFLTYISDKAQYYGATVSSFSYDRTTQTGTLTDNNAHWFTNEWAGQTLYLGPYPPQLAGNYLSITSNTSTTLTFSGNYNGMGSPSSFLIISTGSSDSSVVVVQSIDGGKFTSQSNFAWLTSVNNLIGEAFPLAATGPGTDPVTGNAGGSIWIG